jgi:hypothetical protein
MEILPGVDSGPMRVRDGARIAYGVHGDVENDRRASLVHSLGMDHFSGGRSRRVSCNGRS